MPQPTRPNIIIFMCDDLGWGDLGCYGHDVIQTPHLDRFARQGMLFTDCHASSAVCSPSRAAMLTGRTPYRNGMYTIHMHRKPFPYLRQEELALPSLLRQIGYDTCHVGKWHLSDVEPDSEQPKPGDHGYQHWLATSNNAKPNHLNPVNFVRNGKPVGEIQGNSAGIIVDEATEWIGERKKPEHPFFLTVWTHEPHTPIGTAEEFKVPYNDDLPEKKRDYYGNVTQIDAAFGKLMAYLDEQQLSDNTLVFFTSDNGPAWDAEFIQLGSTGGHRGGKAWMYEGGLRVPGLARWPGHIDPGSVSHAVMTGTDYFPTLLDIVNLPLPADRVIDGESLVDVLHGGDAPKRRHPLYWRYDGADNDLKIAYREGDWVLLADHIIDRCELYHLPSDWQQNHNLVYDEFDRFAAMKQRLLRIHQDVQKDGPSWWRDDPDPLIPWRQNNAIGITRFLVGEARDPAPAPYAQLPAR